MVARKVLSWRRWLILCATVLVVHLWLLQSLHDKLFAAQDARPRVAANALTFDTRTIAAPTPPLEPSHAQTATIRKPPTSPSPALAQPATNTATVVAAETQNEHTLQPIAAADAMPTIEPAPASLPVDKAVADTTQAIAPQHAVSDASAQAQLDTPGTPRAIRPTTTGERPFRVSADVLSGSVRLVYTVSSNKFPYRLSSELLWRNHGDTYESSLRYSALGRTRVQTSRGRIGELGLAPERFSDKYRSEVAAHFNYPDGKITFSANTPDAPLPAGAQDRLSILIQLGAYLASEPARFAPGVTLTIPTVGPRAADLWLFTVVGSEALILPDGTIDSVKLERLPRELYDQKVELWLSPQLSYLPARIRITETNGDSVDQQWQATEAAGEAD